MPCGALPIVLYADKHRQVPIGSRGWAHGPRNSSSDHHLQTLDKNFLRYFKVYCLVNRSQFSILSSLNLESETNSGVRIPKAAQYEYPTQMVSATVNRLGSRLLAVDLPWNVKNNGSRDMRHGRSIEMKTEAGLRRSYFSPGIIVIHTSEAI